MHSYLNQARGQKAFIVWELEVLQRIDDIFDVGVMSHYRGHRLLRNGENLAHRTQKKQQCPTCSQPQFRPTGWVNIEIFMAFFELSGLHTTT